MDKMFDALVITCEHASNWMPRELRPLFEGHEAMLDTHRGFDIGALSLARALADEFSAPLVASRLTRLVLDHNRSLDHPKLSWPKVAALGPKRLQPLVAKYYQAYRTKARGHIAKHIRRGLRTLHFSIHSFTPALDGKVRIAELGLLYDPRHPLEARFAGAMRRRLAANDLNWRVRCNYPYVGWTDAFTTTLRGEFKAGLYAGVELEFNQALAISGSAPKALVHLVADSLSHFV